MNLLGSEILGRLIDPRVALPLCGKVWGQQESSFIPYDPTRTTMRMQAEILDYLAEPPRDRNGQTMWMVLVGYRQGGKSLAAEYGAYCRTARTPGYEHVTLADDDDRARYLHGRVHELHRQWPEQLQAGRRNTLERWQMSFLPDEGGTMTTLSMQKGAVAIGRSPASGHWSEVGFCPEQERQWSMLQPAIINQDNSRFLMEATPNPEDDQGFFHDTYLSGKRMSGRLFSRFYPMWDGKLNRRPWRKEDQPDTEEIRLLERYGPEAGGGLTLDHLAFRRLVMATDPRIRKKPEEFPIWYPLDDVTCWVRASGGVFQPHMLARHKAGALVPWTAPAKRYLEPEDDAIYVIGVDPCGRSARHHGAAHCLRVWSDEWAQAATYAAGREELPGQDPVRSLARWVYDTGKAYGWCLVVVENTGVGQGVIALLTEWGYPNLYPSGPNNDPNDIGVAATTKSKQQMTSYLQDALLDTLMLFDDDTVGQLATYRDDAMVEDHVRTEQLRGEVGRHRRERHHWDKVSALGWAVWGARTLPQRLRVTPLKLPVANVWEVGGWTAEQWAELHASQRPKPVKPRWWNHRLPGRPRLSVVPGGRRRG